MGMFESNKQEGNGMCWDRIVFCPNQGIEGLTTSVIANVLTGEGGIFPVGLVEVFKRRYEIMQTQFMQSCCAQPELWSQGELRLADVSRYHDALLEIPADHLAFQNDPRWMRILQNPCVGHDLPVWMCGPRPIEGRRVMVVAQDPLRTGHGTGKLLLSTPFGLHSADYRDNDGGLLMQLALQLMEDGCTLYFTDFMKIYNRKPEPLKVDRRTERLKSPCKGCQYFNECIQRRDEVSRGKRKIKREYSVRYKECLNREIELFNPNVIITFGVDAAKVLHPEMFRGNGGQTFSELVAPNPWVCGWASGNCGLRRHCIALLHPSGTNANALNRIGGAGEFIQYCTRAINQFF